MKRLTFLIFLLLISIVTVSALSEPMWVVGRVSTPLTDEMYDGIHYYRFNLTVSDSNGSLTMGDEIVVVGETTIVFGLEEDSYYNFTGWINDVQTGEVPEGYFIVSSLEETTTHADWLELFWEVIGMLSGVVAGIADAIVTFIYIGVGYEVPTVAVTAALFGLFVWLLLKHYKTFGLLFALIVGYLVLSGGANLLRLLVWS